MEEALMRKIRILDDIYGKYIYEDLSKLLPDFEYPIKDNVKSPIPYLSEIKDGDIILLDNYFPGEYREEALGDDFLRQYMKLGKNCEIIGISNYGKKITERFEQRCIAYNNGYILDFVTSKRGKDIAETLKIYGL